MDIKRNIPGAQDVSRLEPPPLLLLLCQLSLAFAGFRGPALAVIGQCWLSSGDGSGQTVGGHCFRRTLKILVINLLFRMLGTLKCTLGL